MYPLDKFFLQKKYADNTYRQSFLFLNKHCHAIWQCRNHSSQVIGGPLWWVLIYPLWSHVAVSYNVRTMYVYHRYRLYVTDVDQILSDIYYRYLFWISTDKSLGIRRISIPISVLDPTDICYRYLFWISTDNSLGIRRTLLGQSHGCPNLARLGLSHECPLLRGLFPLTAVKGVPTRENFLKYRCA
jgi:hypothetical protein